MLNRISTAYHVYSEKIKESKEVENFISWLYKQYGYVEKKVDK